MVDESGTPVAAQVWPLATWPEGGVKWAGIGLPAGGPASAGYRLVSGSRAAGGAEAGHRVEVRRVQDPQAEDTVVVDTGAARFVVPTAGPVLLRSVQVDGREVGRDARLVSSVQDGPAPDHAGRVRCTGHVEEVEVEQEGPVRAVVRVSGRHRSDDGARAWLPFTVRLVAAAGARTVRLVHSFVWDGDAEHDFLSSLGLAVDVPLHAEPHDRHVRLAGADGGLMREAVRGLTGLRRDPGAEVREAQMAGRATPPSSTWDQDVERLARWVPTWDAWSLRQHSANGFTIRKRTAADRPWIGVAEGTRAQGFGYVGDDRGGVGLGVTGFWQSESPRVSWRLDYLDPAPAGTGVSG